MGDAALVRHALTNVIHNAIKYTPNGGTISVELKASVAQAVIEVRDTGPGIPATHRDRIFDRFYRVDASRSREEGGVGLGLAIARWAIEANGGRIELVSNEGRGSLFRVVLPLRPTHPSLGKGETMNSHQ
jgi:signal transduction histidine kinase